MTPDERINHEHILTRSLVALADRERSYQTDAHFKHSVDILVRLLPFMVNGIGVQADAEHQDRQAVIESLMRGIFKNPTERKS